MPKKHWGLLTLESAFKAHLALHELGDFGEGKRGAVGFAHEEALEHRLVEVSIRAAGEETVQL